MLLAKTLSPTIESIITGYNLPKPLVGVVIAAIILLPEAMAAIIAARKKQTSDKYKFVAGLCFGKHRVNNSECCDSLYHAGYAIILGLDIKSIVLLGLSVFTVMLSLSSGKSNIVYGVVLLVNLFAFIFLMIYP